MDTQFVIAPSRRACGARLEAGPAESGGAGNTGVSHIVCALVVCSTLLLRSFTGSGDLDVRPLDCCHVLVAVSVRTSQLSGS